MRNMYGCMVCVACLLHVGVSAGYSVEQAPESAPESVPEVVIGLQAVSPINTAALQEVPPIDTSDWPPSPSLVDGVYLWDDPRFTHWPAVVYTDEERNLAFMIHNQQQVAGSIGWPDVCAGGTNSVHNKGEQRVFTLPPKKQAMRVSGLTPLPLAIATHHALLQLGTAAQRLTVHIVGMADHWPHDHLVNGYPVDAAGNPVVIQMARPEAHAQQHSGLIQSFVTRPTGQAVLLGDPMEALGADTWTGLDALRHVAVDNRFPRHAVLCALAKMHAPWPRSIVYSPGNQALFARTWTQEEERILHVIEQRWRALKVHPALILVLPPIPVQAHLQADARTRRAHLRRSALFLGWSIVDGEALAGSADEANKVAAGAFTNYPIAAAQQRVRTAIKKALAR